MRVLITGGYGFIGSHVAEKFYKEGYEIHILDNLSTGRIESVPFNHKSYILATDDPKCKEVFSAFQFDIVVHLAGHYNVNSTQENSYQEAQENILGLINILQLAIRTNVKKFIFASTVAVYGDQPIQQITEQCEPKPNTPFAISMVSAETFCLHLAKDTETEIINLRISNVYGPNLYSSGDNVLVNRLIQQSIEKKPLQYSASDNYPQDYIYVSDVSFAIYRAAVSIMSGTYNLVSGQLSTADEIVHILEKKSNFIESNKTNPSVVKSSVYSYDNSLIKAHFDWVPFYFLEDGIHKTYDYLYAHTVVKRSQEKKQFNVSLPKFAPTIKPYIETILCFIAAYFLFFALFDKILSPFLFGLFYILIIGALYGSRQAFLAMFLSVVFLVTDLLSNGRDIISMLYDSTFLFQLSLFLFVSLVIGYNSDRKKKEIEDVKDQLNDLNKKYNFLQEIYEDVRSVKDELQLRLRNNEDSFGKIYSVIKQLDDLEPEKIFNNTVQVIEQILKCNGVSIYVFNKQKTYLRLVANSHHESERNFTNSLKLAEHEYLNKMIAQKKIFVNKKLEVNKPLMAAPIFYNTEIQAVIMIDHLTFEHFSTYHENLFIVVKELIQTSLWRAFEFLKYSEEARYIKDTNILHFDVFKKLLHTKEEAFQKYQMPYQLLKIACSENEMVHLGEKIDQLLRETDYISYSDGHLYILLSNASPIDLPFIIGRFEKSNIFVQPIHLVEA